MCINIYTGGGILQYFFLEGVRGSPLQAVKRTDNLLFSSATFSQNIPQCNGKNPRYLYERSFPLTRMGIEVSKCVYLASMTVKIEHTVAGHNYDILQRCIFDVHASRTTGPQRGKNCQNICFCPSKLICIQGKLSTNKFCSI